LKKNTANIRIDIVNVAALYFRINVKSINKKPHIFPVVISRSVHIKI